jgi:hypothetical protein
MPLLRSSEILAGVAFYKYSPPNGAADFGGLERGVYAASRCSPKGGAVITQSPRITMNIEAA